MLNPTVMTAWATWAAPKCLLRMTRSPSQDSFRMRNTPRRRDGFHQSVHEQNELQRQTTLSPTDVRAANLVLMVALRAG